MTSLVSEFIINPVIRQARRFSEISRSTISGDYEVSSDPTSIAAQSEASTSAARPRRPSSPRSRPPTSSTQSTRVDVLSDPFAPDLEDMEFESAVMPSGGMPLPEDDGMGALRRRLLEIQARSSTAEEKARLMHEALMASYRRSRAESRAKVTYSSFVAAATTAAADSPPLREKTAPSTVGQHSRESILPLGPLEALRFWKDQTNDAPSPPAFDVSEEDKKPTYAIIRSRMSSAVDGDISTREPPRQVLGCQHYRRNVKLQCSTCHKWYTCRFCHDAAEDHTLIRRETKNMLCMVCTVPQKASDICVSCGTTAARYYCNLCKLWDDHPEKNIYHCNDCGICRRGRGLGKDFFHCKTCQACISISIETSHKCIERSTDCNCPICGDYMFTSPIPVVFMSCGHSIHKKCYDEYIKTSYKCPICNKSLCNMETQFRQIDIAIQSQPMPAEFRDTKAVVLCNDCSAKSSVPYHWAGLKCAVCNSYNTVQLQMISSQAGAVPAPIPAVRRAISAIPTLQHEETGTSGSSLPVEITMPALARHRRYSSLARGQEHITAPDRFARSLTPQYAMEGSAHLDEADESEDEMYRLWGRITRVMSGSEDGSGSEDDDEDDEDDEDEDDNYVGDNDDDDDDPFFLIGHR